MARQSCINMPSTTSNEPETRVRLAVRGVDSDGLLTVAHALLVIASEAVGRSAAMVQINRWSGRPDTTHRLP